MDKSNLKKKSRKKIIIICIIVIILIAALLVFLRFNSRKNIAVGVSYIESEVSYQDVKRSISGSGSLRPANSYSVSVRYAGEIVGDRIEEGDTVTKDQELYIVDTSDSDEMFIESNTNGYISSLFVNAGDSVRQGDRIAEIVDYSTLRLSLNFSALDATRLSAGQDIDVIVDGSFETVNGTIKSVADLAKTESDNIKSKRVIIEIQNPGGLDPTLYASASYGDIKSISSAQFESISKRTLTSNTSGVVEKVFREEGSVVNNGTTILSLTQDESAQRSITSPISGTVIDKAYKRGENVESGATLCTIYDMSYLEIIINVDELDIGSIELGQNVTVTADATSGIEYEGYVSKVSIAGTSSNGTATYPVTVRIDEYGELLPSMNADAVIILEEAKNSLVVPNTAIYRGNMVLLTADSPTAKEILANGGTAEENGYVYAEVSIGISDDDNTQILSGLADGDVVVYTRTSSSSDMGGFPGGFPGGMPSGGGRPSGGFPGGGGSGGRPSGGFTGGGF